MLRATATGGAFFVLAPNVNPDLLGALRRIEADRLDVSTVVERTRARVDAAGLDGTREP